MWVDCVFGNQLLSCFVEQKPFVYLYFSYSFSFFQRRREVSLPRLNSGTSESLSKLNSVFDYHKQQELCRDVDVEDYNRDSSAIND
jgi:hypothetical protein